MNNNRTLMLLCVSFLSLTVSFAQPTDRNRDKTKAVKKSKVDKSNLEAQKLRQAELEQLAAKDISTFDSLQRNWDLENVDVDNINLPPISVFLDAARSYADVKFYEAKKREEELSLKISRKEWLKYFRIQGNYQYGTNNSFLLESGEINPMDTRFLTLRTQSFYNIGVVLSIPLDDVFARKNKNDLVRARIDQSTYEFDKSLEDRQMVILKAYNEVVKHLALLKVNAESVALYDAQMRVSERDFIQGRIDIISLSLERARRTAATITYYESRAALHNAVTMLEMLTKIKIIRQ